MAGTITPCLWFDTEAEAAARFYTGIFPESAITYVSHYAENMPMPAGTVLLVEFTLRGRPMQALNAGPGHPHTEAISLSVDCADQAEIDRIWDALLADGGEPSMCGWLKDRFGVSWQVVPAAMTAMERSATPAQFQRLMQAMMTMVKLDIARLEAAFEGRPA
jgi:predicted 3-demethylubiquinone-9 3-methyltransferase (glyoxalase superfamily)